MDFSEKKKKNSFFFYRKNLSLKHLPNECTLVKIGDLQVVQNRLPLMFFVWDLFPLQYQLVLSRWFRQELSKPAGSTDPTVCRKGWEAMFLIGAFGLSEELSTKVGFAFSYNGLKFQDL